MWQSKWQKDLFQTMHWFVQLGLPIWQVSRANPGLAEMGLLAILEQEVFR